MKLACIYSVWDSEELLSGSVECIKDHVDLIIFVYQDVSNFGEKYSPLPTIEEICSNISTPTLVVKYNPVNHEGMANETAKRNLGLSIAKKEGCTHFLMQDCDEYWENFGAAKQQFIDSGAKSSVAKMWTYFKRPNLKFANPENYFVPFITELEPATVVGKYHYPFYCDPTRKPYNRSNPGLYTEENTILIDEMMHHFSYVRNDISKKIRNSSAKANIQRSSIMTDYSSNKVGHGYYVAFFNQKLTVTKNIFNITIST